MSGQRGTIVELDPVDALGWIELDEGGRVRFGGTALKGWHPSQGVGTRVEVRGTVPGFRGVPKAVEVVPLVPVTPVRPAPRPAPAVVPVPWPELVRAHPRWSDVADTVLPCARPAPPSVLPAHPLFAPWHEEICATAPTMVDLVVPHYLKPEPIEPGPGDCFALGRVAFLDAPRWPTCGLCGGPLTMCLQVAPDVLADFVPGGRGLAALFCFRCGPEHPADPRVGHVRLVTPAHRVVGPDAWCSDAERRLSSATQRVTPRAPRAFIPDAGWHRARARVTPETAASALLGGENAWTRFTGPFPAGLDLDDLDDPGETFDDWAAQDAGAIAWSGARLGGPASWKESDHTPSCPHGAMRHLLDHEGGQFLEGALHVFACPVWACDLAFVAEL
jgi:hypothetical protein